MIQNNYSPFPNPKTVHNVFLVIAIGLLIMCCIELGIQDRTAFLCVVTLFLCNFIVWRLAISQASAMYEYADDIMSFMVEYEKLEQELLWINADSPEFKKKVDAFRLKCKVKENPVWDALCEQELKRLVQDKMEELGV